MSDFTAVQETVEEAERRHIERGHAAAMGVPDTGWRDCMAGACAVNRRHLGVARLHCETCGQKLPEPRP